MAKKFISLKREIGGIKDIRETVKTLEKISATNIHRLKIISQNMENYEFLLGNILKNSRSEFISHPFFRKFSKAKRLGVVLTTEKGLCGGLLNNLVDFIQLNSKSGDEFIVIGEKGRSLFKERKIKIENFFNSWKEIPREEEIREIKNLLISEFLKEKYKEILIFYPSFENLGLQKPKIFTFLPLGLEEFEEKLKENFEESIHPIYEPNREKVRDYLIKEYLGLVFYQKVLETKLSELSARTVAMEKAEEKSKKILLTLSHQYFKVKRGAITRGLVDLYSSHRR